jgi:hypothetical protein
MPATRAAALDNHDFAAIASAFQQYGSVSFPSDRELVLLVIALPGEVWHLTDLTTMTHYSLLHAGDAIQVRRDAQVYVAPTEVQIGPPGKSRPWPQGVHVEGEVDLLVVSACVTVVATSSGLCAEVDIDPIELLDGRLLSITDATGQHGPTLSLATFSRPGQTPPLDRPHFLLSGRLALLGLEVSRTYVSVTSDGLEIDVSSHVTPLVLVSLKGTLAKASMSASGEASVGVDHTFDLGPLGRLPLNDKVVGKLEVELAGGTVTIAFSGFIVIQGTLFAVPNFTLPFRPAVLVELSSLVEAELESILPKLIDDAAVWLQWVHSGIVQGVTDAGQIAGVLSSSFKKTADEVATMLHDAGYSALAAAEALRQAIGLAASAAIEALTKAGYAPSAVAKSVEEAFSLTLSELSSAMTAAGQALPTIASILATFASPSTLALALLTAGFPLASVASALVSGLGLSEAGLVSALSGANVGIEDIASAIGKTFGLSAEQVVSILDVAGFGAGPIGLALRIAFGLPVEEVGKLLQGAFGLDEDELNRVLGEAGFTLAAINSVLELLFPAWHYLNPANW